MDIKQVELLEYPPKGKDANVYDYAVIGDYPLDKDNARRARMSDKLANKEPNRYAELNKLVKQFIRAGFSKREAIEMAKKKLHNMN